MRRVLSSIMVLFLLFFRATVADAEDGVRIETRLGASPPSVYGGGYVSTANFHDIKYVSLSDRCRAAFEFLGKF